ncbi:MAG: universal stress protein [bacterium]
MKILFCTDGSEASFYAIRRALPFLIADSQIDIVNIVDLDIWTTYVTFSYEEEEVSEIPKSAAQLILNKAEELIELEGYKVGKTNYFRGSPSNIILRLINSDNYDLVVLGSHGKKGLKKWIGSVSRKVVTKSSIPVLIVKPQEEAEIPRGLKEVLITVDGSDCSYNAIKKMPEFLNLQNSSIEVLNIRIGSESLPVEITMDSKWLENLLIKQKESANKILDESKKILQENNISIKSAFSLEGDAAEIILNYISEHKKDLIIMGSHGREGISDLILGSVSKRVLDFAICPVLIIPTKIKKID